MLCSLGEQAGSDTGSGTGFLVRPNLLVTNAHVIRLVPVDRLKVYFPSAEGGKTPLAVGALLYEDRKRDLAFLTVESPLPALALLPRYEFQRGQNVTVIGNPGLGDNVILENAVSQGVMSRPIQIKDRGF